MFLAIQTVISPKKVINLINHVKKPIIAENMMVANLPRGLGCLPIRAHSIVKNQSLTVVTRPFFRSFKTGIIADIMAEEKEKRGPIEKGEKGWPINPLGVFALVIFLLIVVLLIARPLFVQKTTAVNPEQGNAPGGRIISPVPGEIIRGGSLKFNLDVDNVDEAEKVQFWAKTYADGKWQMIGEVKIAPFILDWQIPVEFENKAIAVTTHIYQKDGDIVKDPGGWREGIIILFP